MRLTQETCRILTIEQEKPFVIFFSSYNEIEFECIIERENGIFVFDLVTPKSFHQCISVIGLMKWP